MCDFATITAMATHPYSGSLLRTCKRSTITFVALLLLALAPLALSHVDPAHLHLDDSANHCELCLNQGALAGTSDVAPFSTLPLQTASAATPAKPYTARPLRLAPIRGPPSLFN